MGWFLLVAIGLPILEIVVIVQVAGTIGAGWTVLLLLGSALLGLLVMRRAGASWWGALRAGDAESRLPDGRAVTSAALLFVAGVLLLLPGFLTGGMGLVLLLPPVRVAMHRWAVGWFNRRFVAVTGPGGATLWTRGGNGSVVRGEVVRDDVGPRPPSPDDPPALPGSPRA